MYFINKLIKRGIYGLIVCFSFFYLFGGTNVEAAECVNPSINLVGEKYIVVNRTLRWSDDGVIGKCGDVRQNNVTVDINDGAQVISSVNSGLDEADRYVTLPGFYKIKYYLTNNDDVSVTRYLRVLDDNLNNNKNFWLSDTVLNTSENDAFTKIIDSSAINGYLAVGNFGDKGYVVAFNKLGEMIWNKQIKGPDGTSNLIVTDIVKSGNQNTYYISGNFNINSVEKGFVKTITLTENVNEQLDFGTSDIIVTGINDMAMVNKIVYGGNKVYAVGYQYDGYSNKHGVIAEMTGSDATETYILKSGDYSSSEYNSLIMVGEDKLLTVGSATFSNSNAIGGLITTCLIKDNADFILDCEMDKEIEDGSIVKASNSKVHLYQNSNLASVTTTKFRDVVSHGTDYIVVGESRIDSIYGNVNKGLEDGIVLLLNSNLNIVDAKLVGDRLADTIKSVKQIENNNYIAVGEKSSAGYYVIINADNEVLTIDEQTISAEAANVKINDVFVSYNDLTKEKLYLFVGESNAVKKIEDVVFKCAGGNDAIFAIIDATEYLVDESFSDNYVEINIKKGNSMCSNNTLVECQGNEIASKYKLKYGNESYSFPEEFNISTNSVGNFSTYHGFENSQGVMFKIGRVIIVTEYAVAPDLEIGEVGINKWFLYSRPQNVTSTTEGTQRFDMWNEYYYPVEDGKAKQAGIAYYVLDGKNGFKVDNSNRETTRSNYILLSAEYYPVENDLLKEPGKIYYVLNDKGIYVEDVSSNEFTNSNFVARVEPQNTTAAFQSVETAKEFAMMQEFTRIAFVGESYNNYSSFEFGKTYITPFYQESASLKEQSYFFVYYIDANFVQNKNENAQCRIVNFEVLGDCTSFTGYAFSNLDKIKNVAKSVVEKNNYFVSEKNDKNPFNPNGNIPVPETSAFKEEMSTVKYLKNLSINLMNEGLTLEVKYYAPNGDSQTGYDGFPSLDNWTDSEYFTYSASKKKVDFSSNGDVRREGKYVVRYCYNYGNLEVQRCGSEATFIIDRTAPILNYEAYDESEGQISIIGSISMRTNFFVRSIVDVDPYAYTIIDNKIFYLVCNEEINSAECGESFTKYILRKFEHDKTDPEKRYSINAYDRAGNYISFDFKIGGAAPTLTITPDEAGNSFAIDIDFYEKNAIDSFSVSYTKSEECTECANAEKIKEALLNYITAISIKNSNLIAKKMAENPDYDPLTDEEIIRVLPTLLFEVSGSYIDINGDLKEGKGLVLQEVIDTTVVDEEGNPIQQVLFPETILTISKGLYRITMVDTFMNASTVYAGIGIAKTELDIYINGDEDYDDRDTLKNEGASALKLPGDQSTIATFLATSPVGYSYEIPESLMNTSFDSNLFFTNKFVYIKFEINSYSKITISRATKINPLGDYRIASSGDVSSSMKCLFTLYGSQIASIYTSECKADNQIELTDEKINEKSSLLINEGIYVMKDADYYILVFTNDGTYKVHNEIISDTEVQEPTEHTFFIDSTTPTVKANVFCEIGNCKGVQPSYDANGYTTNDEIKEYDFGNIGNYSVKINLSKEYLMYINENGEIVYVRNKLLVFSTGGESYRNAFDYSLNEGEDPEGNTIIFRESGAHTLVFIDATGNVSKFKFFIDANPPQIEELTSANGSDFNQYQQYASVNVSVSESTFLDKVEGASAQDMLIIKYKFGTSDYKYIKFSNELDGEGKCLISEGSANIDNGAYNCTISGEPGSRSISVNFIVTLNKEERYSGEVKFSVEAIDFFGNVSTTDPKMINFDNYSPYIYYEGYTPTRNYGENVSNDEREKWITTKSITIDEFNCDNAGLLEGKVVCKDMPNSNTSNKVTIKAYEVSRVSINNYILLNKNYVYQRDGKYIPLNTQLYKYVNGYSKYSSESDLQSAINDSNSVIYSKYNRVKVNELIDPNQEYYYYDEVNKNWKMASINELYSKDYCDGSDSKSCDLYTMYQNNGYFTDTNFFTYNDGFVRIEDKTTIVLNRYEHYYYDNKLGYYEKDDGVFLPAVTLENSCVSVNGGECIRIAANKIKLNSASVVYYNIINKANTDSYDREITLEGGTIANAMVDDNVWRIAVDDSGKEVPFGFNLESNLGRPIIFKSTDGAGNKGTNHLETIVAITDTEAPAIKDVSTLKFIKDESESTTTSTNSYIKDIAYYRVYDISKVTCDTMYYTYDFTQSKYEKVSCVDSWSVNPKNIYYIGIESYQKVESGILKESGKDYYFANINTTTNYLTDENFIVTFNEPIYRVECSYYISGNEIQETRECIYNNVEFNYYDNRTSFELVYEGEGQYFVNYMITVYDFSGNSMTISSLFTDRQNPEIIFQKEEYKETILEVDYSDNTNKVSDYNQNYIKGKNDKGYLNYTDEIHAEDSVNERISEMGASGVVNNKFEYKVSFKKFNYNITYKNYTRIGNTFTAVKDGMMKNSGPYYILIENKGTYDLRGNSGFDINGETCDVGDYCYILDDHSYYPNLLTNDTYWESADEVSVGEIGVYKVEYYVIDNCKNVSNTIIKTIYVVDTQAPNLEITGSQDSESNGKFGYHKTVDIKVKNEKQMTYYIYTCGDTSLTCELPSKIIESKEKVGQGVEFIEPEFINSSFDRRYAIPGIYKIYFQDLGDYTESKIYADAAHSNDADASSEQIEIRTLKYNYGEYQFVIDAKKPEFKIEAMKDNDKLYYEVSLTQEEYLYCVVGDRNSGELVFGPIKEQCHNYLRGTPQIETNQDGTQIKYKIFDSNEELIYQRIFEKIPYNAPKYFYNTYYKKDGNSFTKYDLGDSYEEDNVYIITSILLYFREDGNYLIRAQDKAGNMSGRLLTANKRDESESSFVIDNTKPTYNQNNNMPTGGNYWFSVPREIISNSNKNKITQIGQKTGNYYNLFSSGLNDEFFYGFATQYEAKEYLIKIYSEHINSLDKSGSCFSYTYYDGKQKSMITNNCFANGEEALNKVIIDTIPYVIYETFSGAALFSDSTVNQTSIDQNMYKFIYLKTENGKTQVSYTCVDSVTVKCVKVNVKIIHTDSNNGVELKLGASNLKDPDSAKIDIYSMSIDGELDSDTLTSSGTFLLNNTTYYVFVETDRVIGYDNYPVNTETQTFDITHWNTTYYAVYVDNKDYLNVYTEDDSGSYDTSITPGGEGSIKTNDNNYYLIIKNLNNDPYFNEKYEIYEYEKVGEDGSVYIERYSYLRLSIGGVSYNINDYLINDENGYYFRIPVVNVDIGLGEFKISVLFHDRSGNETKVDISHSQRAPEFNLVYTFNQDGKVLDIYIYENNITRIETGENEFVVHYSKEGINYTSDKDGIIQYVREALLCQFKNELNPYKCESGSANGKNYYKMTLTDAEELFGFFKIDLADDHGNTNSIEFIYNYPKLEAIYVDGSNEADYTFIGPDANGISTTRMVTNTSLLLKWDNKFDYIILYRQVDDQFIEVCNTKNVGLGIGDCGDEEDAIKFVNGDDNSYAYSTLKYTKEGFYKAEIFNRQSEIINARCYDENGVLKEDCKNMKTEAAPGACDWQNNEVGCSASMQVVNKKVIVSNGNNLFELYQIDKTIPVLSEEYFNVKYANRRENGVVIYENENLVNNGIYTNGNIEFYWQMEEYEQYEYTLKYTCRYFNVNTGVEGAACQGNSYGAFSKDKSVETFKANAQGSKTTYTMILIDAAGNQSDAITFSIEVVLPKIMVFEEVNGSIGEEPLISSTNEKETKIQNNARLLCYDKNSTQIACEAYDVYINRRTNIQNVTEPAEGGYEIVRNKNGEIDYYILTGATNKNESIYTSYVIKTALLIDGNLNVGFEFTIDKVAPKIEITGTNKVTETGEKLYRDTVTIRIDDSKGTFNIYDGCVLVDVENNEYSCNEEPLHENVNNPNGINLSKTGIYKITAVDDIGNVATTRYVNIDNEAPDIKITAKSEYLDYDLAENAYTNVEKIVIESIDNRAGSDVRFKIKKLDGTYVTELNGLVADEQNWLTFDAGSLASIYELTIEGMYTVQAVDFMGHVSMERHFIIYRQKPDFHVEYDPSPDNNDHIILSGKFSITWVDPINEMVPPIVKVTVNGNSYQKGTKIEEIGEYLFIITDLAGNTATHRLTLNNGKEICLDNVTITPKKQFIKSVDKVEKKIYFSSNEGYVFKEGDVLIFASRINYFGGSSACGTNVISYGSILNKGMVVLFTARDANNFNNATPNQKAYINVNNKDMAAIEKLGGGDIYIFVVDKEVAEEQLGFVFKTDSFFKKDPIGWTMIIVAGVGFIYLGLKMTLFRKKVKVLK